MFLALLCPSSGARDYDVDYHIGRIVLGLLYVGGKVQLHWSSVRAAGSSTAISTVLVETLSLASVIYVCKKNLQYVVNFRFHFAWVCMKILIYNVKVKT